MGYDVTLGLLSKESVDQINQAVENPSQRLDYRTELLSQFVANKIRALEKSLMHRENFVHDSGYILATILQSIEHSWYMRGNSYGALFASQSMIDYLRSKDYSKNDFISSWGEVIPTTWPTVDHTVLCDNYSIGALASPQKLEHFIACYKADPVLRKLVNSHMSHNVYVLMDAIATALHKGKYLFEADGLVTPNVTTLNTSTSLISLEKCNSSGAVMYILIGQYQMASIKNDDAAMQKAESNFLRIVNEDYERLKLSYSEMIPAFTEEEGFEPNLSRFAMKQMPQKQTQNKHTSSVPLGISKEKFFYILILHSVKNGAPYTLHYITSEGLAKDTYASRVMPGDKLYQAIKEDLRRDFGYTKHFEIRGSNHVDTIPDKKGNPTERYKVDVLLHGAIDVDAVGPLGFRILWKKDETNRSKAQSRYEVVWGSQTNSLPALN